MIKTAMTLLGAALAAAGAAIVAAAARAEPGSDGIGAPEAVTPASTVAQGELGPLWFWLCDPPVPIYGVCRCARCSREILFTLHDYGTRYEFSPCGCVGDEEVEYAH
jgi:hypothetical protein